MLPVVYVVGVGETTIAADVQAEVAVELDDDADVRFADERAEAVLEDRTTCRCATTACWSPSASCRPDDVDPVDVDVEVYRSEADWSQGRADDRPARRRSGRSRRRRWSPPGDA